MFIVTDQDGNPIYTAGYAQACHEHINGAINEFDIEGAGKWKVVEVVPKQRELELLAVIKELREALTRISGYNLQSNPSTVAQDALDRTEHYQEGS